MKKLCFLIMLSVCTMATYAATVSVAAGENALATAVAAAASGDVLELGDGAFTEWNAITLDKQLTIKAAEGAKPVVKIYNLKITAPVEFNGLDIENISSDNYLLRVYTSVDGTVAFRSCNFTNQAPTYFLVVKESTTLANLTIDNCTFVGATKNDLGGFISASSGSVSNFYLTNSTFVNNSKQDCAVYMTAVANAYVDHCTFYNCGTRVLYLTGMTTSLVQNCVVANPTETSNYCIAAYSGEVKNIVYYNTTAPRSGSTNTNCKNADPKFIDAANGDFSFKSTSPLYQAATDGTNIGDPRWEVQMVYDDIPGTITAENVSLSSGATVTDGQICFTPSTADQEWAQWNINATKSGVMSVSIHIEATNGHKYGVALYDGSTLVSSTAEPSQSSATGDIALANVSVPAAGHYVLKLTNATKWSEAKLNSITLAYTGGAEVVVPATLPNEDAVLTGPKIALTADGIAWNDNGDASADYATWKIRVTNGGNYQINMTVSTAKSSGHSFSVSVYDSSSALVETINEPSGTLALEAGSYTIRLNNATQWSSAIMESVSVSYLGGAVVSVPGTLPAEEAVLTGKIVRNEHSIQWPNESDVDAHYATWNVSAAAAGSVDVTLNIAPSSGHCFTIGLYEGDVLKASISETGTLYTTGAVAVGTLVIPAAGNYTVRLTNSTEWSSTIVESVTMTAAVEPDLVTLDETASDNTVLSTYKTSGETINVQLTRTLVGNDYNTFCLPFSLTKAQLEAAGLGGAEILQLASASIEGTVLYLDFSTQTSIYKGVPYLVKPLTDVVNPVFENVVIAMDEGAATHCNPVWFISTFVKTTVEASENSFVLGSGGSLYYTGYDIALKGYRAYFKIDVPSPSAMPKRMEIRNKQATPTQLQSTESVNNGVHKAIENGRVVIRVDGKIYNMMGAIE